MASLFLVVCFYIGSNIAENYLHSETSKPFAANAIPAEPTFMFWESVAGLN